MRALSREQTHKDRSRKSGSTPERSLTEVASGLGLKACQDSRPTFYDLGLGLGTWPWPWLKDQALALALTAALTNN